MNKKITTEVAFFKINVYIFSCLYLYIYVCVCVCVCVCVHVYEDTNLYNDMGMT